MSKVVQASSLQPFHRASWKLALPYAAALFVFGGSAVCGAIVEDTIDRVYDLNGATAVSIRNTDGRIHVYGSDTAQLRIKAVRRAFTKERLEAIKVEVAIKGDTAAIETIYPPAPPPGSILADRSGTVDYTILVPDTCALSKVELANGEVVIEGMRGTAIDARLGNGLIYLSNCFSATRASLGQGGLEVLYGWWEALAFTLSAEVGKGDLRLALPVEASLHLDAATTEGHIRNNFATEETLGDARTLDTKIGGDGSTTFRLRTTRGNIRIGKTY